MPSSFSTSITKPIVKNNGSFVGDRLRFHRLITSAPLPPIRKRRNYDGSPNRHLLRIHVGLLCFFVLVRPGKEARTASRGRRLGFGDANVSVARQGRQLLRKARP